MTLAAELDLDAVLQRIVELAVELTGATYGALAVLNPDDTIREFITTGVTTEQRAAIGDPPTGRGVLGLLVREGHPIRLPRISDHPASVGFPAHHPPMTSFLGAPVSARGRVFGNIYLTDKRGAPGLDEQEFDEQDEEALVVLAAQAGTAIENARLYEEATTRQRWLEAVREIGGTILTRGNPDDALHMIADRALTLTGADVAVVAVPEGIDHLRVAHAEGLKSDRMIGTIFPIDGSISGEVVRSGNVSTADASTDDRDVGPIASAGGFGPTIVVPLVAHGRAFGTLSAAYRLGRPAFATQEIELIKTFADQAAAALEYARVQQEIERLVVLEDRERIAKELHDGVIQALFAVGMGLEATAMMTGEGELTTRIEGAVNEIDRVIRDLRNYIFGLRPGILADRELDKALRTLVDEFQAQSGVVTIIELDEEVAAGLASVAGDVVQLTREALSNIGRHAHATTCRVTLRHEDHTAVLEVDDDGTGFDPATVKRGDGLTNLEHRAESLGGTASIGSIPHQGTTVRIELPL